MYLKLLQLIHSYSLVRLEYRTLPVASLIADTLYSTSTAFAVQPK
jgi:hypothetical protein